MGDTRTAPGKVSKTASGVGSKKRSSTSGSTPVAKGVSAVKRAGRNMVASMLRRADIQSVKLASADASTLKIDEVDIGDASVERVSLANIRTLVNTGRLTMNNVRTLMSMRIRVRWEVRIWGPNPSGSFTFTVPFDIPFNVGDLEIPGLDDLDIQVPSGVAEDTTASVQPIANLTFNGGRVDNIEIADIRLPVNGYGLAGVGFDSFTLSHVGVPDASIGKVTIGSLIPNGLLTLPSAEISNIGIGNVSVPSVTSNRPVTVSDITATPPPFRLIDLWILFVDIQLLPVMTMSVDGVTLDDMEATSTISSITLENMRFPLQVKGMELSDISVTGLRANEISL